MHLNSTFSIGYRIGGLLLLSIAQETTDGLSTILIENDNFGFCTLPEQSVAEIYEPNFVSVGLPANCCFPFNTVFGTGQKRQYGNIIAVSDDIVWASCNFKNAAALVIITAMTDQQVFRIPCCTFAYITSLYLILALGSVCLWSASH